MHPIMALPCAPEIAKPGIIWLSRSFGLHVAVINRILHLTGCLLCASYLRNYS